MIQFSTYNGYVMRGIRGYFFNKTTAKKSARYTLYTDGGTISTKILRS